MVQTGIVLQGGGALGAYEYGALKRLYEDPAFQPTLVSGVSIGAITAAALVGGKGNPVDVLAAIWEKFTAPSFPLMPEYVEQHAALLGNANFFRLRTDYIDAPRWTSFYDTSPLRRVLDEFIDFAKIQESPIQLFLTATNIVTGCIEVFDNRTGVITPDHVMASAALPPGFPMVQIDHEYFWDGGLFDNSPLSPIIEHMDPDPEVPKQIIVLNLFPGQGNVPTNVLEVRDRMLEISYSNKFRAAAKDTERINQFVEVMQAIDRSLPNDDVIRTLPGYERLKQYMLVNDIVYIENRDPESLCAAFDFSRRSIEARIRAGYRDAQEALGARALRALPEGLLRSNALTKPEGALAGNR